MNSAPRPGLPLSAALPLTMCVFVVVLNFRLLSGGEDPLLLPPLDSQDFSLEDSWRPDTLHGQVWWWLRCYIKAVWFGFKLFRESSSYSRSQCNILDRNPVSDYLMLPFSSLLVLVMYYCYMIVALQENGLGHSNYQRTTPLLFVVRACTCSRSWLCVLIWIIETVLAT